MMNQREFHEFCREHEGKFSQGFRVVEGAVRMNSNESHGHFLKKADVVFHIKRKILSELLDEGRTPKWYEPRVYTEVKINENVFDVVALTLSGAFIFEIAKSENEKSLNAKEAAATELHYNFDRVYCG